MRTTDRRFVKTEKTIVDSCIALLSEEKMSYITIEDVCYKADVNKSTFYLHYQSLDALFSAIEDAAISLLFKEISAVSASNVETLIEPLVSFAKVNKKLLYAAYSVDRYRFNGKFRNLILPYLKKTKPDRRGKIDDENVFIEFSLIDFLFSVLRMYVLDGCHYKQDEIVEIIMSILKTEKFKSVL